MWEALAFETTLPVLKHCLNAIKAWHQRLQLRVPLDAAGDNRRSRTARGLALRWPAATDHIPHPMASMLGPCVLCCVSSCLHIRGAAALRAPAQCAAASCTVGSLRGASVCAETAGLQHAGVLVAAQLGSLAADYPAFEARGWLVSTRPTAGSTVMGWLHRLARQQSCIKRAEPQ